MKTNINGMQIHIEPIWQEENLLVFLREHLDLTGSKNGCNKGVCGACTILVNDEAKPACRIRVSQIIDKEILTIEGMSRLTSNGEIHPLQQAFIDHGAIQCGYCTPGMVLRAHSFLLHTPHPTRSDIRKAISPNLCRCTGYQQIIDAIETASIFYKNNLKKL